MENLTELATKAVLPDTNHGSAPDRMSRIHRVMTYDESWRALQSRLAERLHPGRYAPNVETVDDVLHTDRRSFSPLEGWSDSNKTICWNGGNGGAAGADSGAGAFACGWI
jgi:hypothetical protein